MNTAVNWVASRVSLLSEMYRPNRRALGLFRIVYAISLLVEPRNIGWIKDVPASFFNPGPGVQAAFSLTPPDWYVTLLEIAGYVVAIWLLIGWRTTSASIATVVVSILAASLLYSFSKVDHTLLYQAIPLIMIPLGWGGAYSIDAARGDRRRDSDGFPLVIWSMIIAFSMATAAAAKAIGGWWRPTEYGAWHHVAADYVDGERTGVLAHFVLVHGHPVMWKLVDWGTLFAEGWLVVAMFSPTLFRVAMVILPLFHVSVFLMMDIRFETFALVYAPFFLCAPRQWLPGLLAIKRRWSNRGALDVAT